MSVVSATLPLNHVYFKGNEGCVLLITVCWKKEDQILEFWARKKRGSKILVKPDEAPY